MIFILDVSGSMSEPTKGDYVGKAGKTRIEVAKEELIKCIDALDPDSLFNIEIFSSDVERWLENGVAQFSKSNKDEAKAYVGKLGANGGTNLYGAMKDAFRTRTSTRSSCSPTANPRWGTKPTRRSSARASRSGTCTAAS